MVKEENWAIAPERVRAFFEEFSQTEATEDGFLLDGCEIRLTAIDATLFGKWAMKRTGIRIDGPEDAVKALYQKFFLRFLSAGG